MARKKSLSELLRFYEHYEAQYSLANFKGKKILQSYLICLQERIRKRVSLWN
jgi:hypothetical protein